MPIAANDNSRDRLTAVHVIRSQPSSPSPPMTGKAVLVNGNMAKAVKGVDLHSDAIKFFREVGLMPKS